MINRRSWLGGAVLSGLVSACVGAKTELSSRKKTSLSNALMVVQTSSTEVELFDSLGPPNATDVFDPDNKSDSSYMNRYPRSEWPNIVVFVPPTLINTLPAGTKLLVYVFEYGPLVLNPTVGALEICVDSRGRILGCYYSKSLEGVEKLAALNSHG